MSLLSHADDKPTAAIAAFAAVTYAGLSAWSLLSRSPVLLASARPDHRGDIYGLISNSSVAMLGISLTVLAILVALPDRPGVEQLRSRRSWSLLQGGLIATAGFCLLTMLSSIVASAIDTADRGREWLSNLVLTLAAAAVVSVVLFGFAFWLTLRAADDEVDPATKRVSG